MARPSDTAGLRWAPEYGPAMNTPHITAKPHAIVMTAQPAPSAFVFFRQHPATTPSPRSMSMKVPMNSNRQALSNIFYVCFRFVRVFDCSTVCTEPCCLAFVRKGPGNCVGPAVADRPHALLRHFGAECFLYLPLAAYLIDSLPHPHCKSGEVGGT